MKKFNVKDKVMARWPGSSLWFEGTIVDLNDIEYQVRFTDEGKSEFVVKHRDVKLRTDFHARKRSKSRGRSRSRGRTGRSPGRPSKYYKEPEIVKEEVIQTPTKQLTKQLDSEPLILNTITQTPDVAPRSRVISTDHMTPRTSTPMRQSPRLSTSKDKNDIDGQVNNVKPVTETVVAAPSLGSRMCGLTCRVGSGIKAIIHAFVPAWATIKTVPLIIGMMIMPIILNESCTRKKCTVMEFPSIPRTLQYYYDPLAMGIVGAFLAVQIILYFIPLGRVVKPPNGATARCNGWIAVVLSLASLPLLMYMDYSVLVVYSKYRQLLATSLALMVLTTLVGYIRGAYIPNDAKNPTGNSGLFLPDLFSGREMAPAIKRLDVKFFSFRVTCIAWIMINVIIAVKDLQANPGQYSPTLLMACLLQIFYAADWVWFEETYFTTYEYTRTGYGLFLTLGHASMIFTLPIFTRLILNHRTELEWYYLSLIAIVNLIGYTITRAANSQKHAFRSNPSAPALAHLESLPTSAGTNLLVSGWWGRMRHPNYTGDMLVIISWALLCGFKYALPWVMVALDMFFLVGRTFEVEAACKRKYGASWESYTTRVRYRLIPRVF
ncbi:hypothetical protein Pmani_037584 [Petrolisthes manimaculis]|uniref:Lamin-B receptor of TUDOR domain-containing protein n=1 Tax=Petrolisthes manimaculis TaxID=1843537 RepID=A0AAE1TN49_9EUCA|nr:hypothetical protein Pmani_037584 [Petrolisthes manimaculis]